jgi:hypothetical protein
MGQGASECACAVALIDRLTHHAESISIDGESYRKREAEQTQKRKQDQNRSGDHAAMLTDSVQNYAVLHERQQPEIRSDPRRAET